MYQETRRKPRNTSHVEPKHPTRKPTSVVAGGTNGNTTNDVVLVAAIRFDLPYATNALKEVIGPTP